jgi:hypothetical protein
MRKIYLLMILWLAVSCELDPSHYREEYSDPELLHTCMHQLTETLVHDIFSPPAASRAYAYPSIAAFEIMALRSDTTMSLAGQLNGLAPIPRPKDGERILYEVAAMEAFLTVSRAMIFSDEQMAAFRKKFDGRLRRLGAPFGLLDRSKRYGRRVARHILKWADEDNYRETRTFAKHAIDNNPGGWRPTPPTFMDAIEPHWSELRPFILDSAGQFAPEPPPAFDLTEGSEFHRELLEVYQTVREADEEKRAIASFWDCNPYIAHQRGHVMYATKKITPGGHWMGIAQIASRQAGDDFFETTRTFAYLSVGLADAFIACWDEKYRSNLIRPETAIHTHWDEDWQPVLQTPPFPEYTSGHSVVSTTAAHLLTGLYGDDFSFNDTVEVVYGLPERSYPSFAAAAEEAAISRVYGGIHYPVAVDQGVWQGREVGQYVARKLRIE